MSTNSQSAPLLPYGRQSVDEDDIAAVIEVLRSAWLTTGPKVGEFESAVAHYTHSGHAVAVSSGTAALHAMMHALNIGPGDEVIVPTITFAATANCAVFQGAAPVFVDVQEDTLLIDPDAVEAHITDRTRAIVAVDYAGQACDYTRLSQIAQRHDLALLADACHSLGGEYHGRRVGSLAQMSAFSFHPVKPLTTCEGGMVTTDDESLAGRMRTFRNHGIRTDHRQRSEAGTWHYEMRELGFNYRLSDVQCALGLSQLQKLPRWLSRREEIARQYDAAFAGHRRVRPLQRLPHIRHAWHLYVARWQSGTSGLDRKALFETLRAAGLGVNVHYIPVHLHPFYRERFGTRPGQCPVAEAAYQQIVSLPIFPGMSDADVSRVVETLNSATPARKVA